MRTTGRGIGLLGGSFDPVHNGHIAISESFLASGFISELWILLTPDPPHKKDKSLVDYEVRLRMLRDAFQQMDRVVISDIENKLPRPSYTIQTLQILNEKYPDENFYLCIGGDSVRDFKQWRDWKDILDYCELLVARRPSDRELQLDSNLASKAHFVTHEPVEISSTKIRKLISRGEDISNLVPPKVKEMIEKENLYKTSL